MSATVPQEGEGPYRVAFAYVSEFDVICPRPGQLPEESSRIVARHLSLHEAVVLCEELNWRWAAWSKR